MKASVLDKNGRMLHDRLRVETPKKVTPRQLVGLIAGLIPTLPRFDRVSVGFPGVVRNGVVLTAPNLGTDRFHRFNLARALGLLGRTDEAIVAYDSCENSQHTGDYAERSRKAVERLTTRAGTPSK